MKITHNWYVCYNNVVAKAKLHILISVFYKDLYHNILFFVSQNYIIYMEQIKHLFKIKFYSFAC